MISAGIQAQDTGAYSYMSFVPKQYDSFTYRKAEYQSSDSTRISYPDPQKVMYQSLMIPGWGQVTNRQVWKVPIVYGVLGGLGYYSVYLHKKYHDYQAAYYNAVYGEDSDFRFGPTPAYIPANANESALKANRNFFRNRRDFVYISIGLAYALNVIDAYVFAHLRSFDVSDDLSMNANIEPSVIHSTLAGYTPSVSLSFKLSKN